MTETTKRGTKTRQQRTKKPTQTMMAMMPPRLTWEWSMHQCPKCDLQALAVLPLLPLEALLTLCRLAEKVPPLLAMAACMRLAQF